MTIINLAPRGREWLKLLRPFVWTRHWPLLRRLHRYCGSISGWCCAGCAADIEEASREQAVYAALDAECRPLPGPDGILLDVLDDLVERRLGAPVDDDEFEDRFQAIYDWAAERGVRVRI